MLTIGELPAHSGAWRHCDNNAGTGAFLFYTLLQTRTQGGVL